MATGEPGVNVLRPPTRLYNLWKSGSGEVTSTSKRHGLYDARLANQQEQDESASPDDEDEQIPDADVYESNDERGYETPAPPACSCSSFIRYSVNGRTALPTAPASCA